MSQLVAWGKKLAPGFLALILALIGYEAYHAYMIEHQYYYTMIRNSDNRGMTIWMIIIGLGASIPLRWYKTKPNLKYLLRGVFGAIIFGGFIHVSYKGGLIGSSGSFIFMRNMIFVLLLMVILITGLTALGATIWTKIKKSALSDWSDIFLSFGLGLGIMLLVNFVLLWLQLFYPIVIWAQLIGLIVLARHQSSHLSDIATIISDVIHTIHKKGIWTWIFVGLVVISLVYINLGFQLSFIPYSTAWDANHAYMYYPKVRAGNNGFFFTQGPVAPSQIWMVFIAFWFSLLKPLTSFTMAPDTLAVMMNNMSGWFSLIFGLGALAKALQFVDSKIIALKNNFNIAFALGRGYFLLWLTSGMGAFLVFVDNKTDLGVMTLTMLAIMSGFIFIEKYNQTTSKEQISTNRSIYAIVSGLLFGLAIMSKPTAFQDALLFGLLLIGLWVGLLGVAGLFLIILGVLGRAETMSIVFYISKNLATKLGLLGVVATIGEAVRSYKKLSLKLLRPFVYRIIGILAILIPFKGGYILTQQIISDTLNPSTLIKGILLGERSQDTNEHTEKSTNNKRIPKFLVADTGDSTDLMNNENLPTQETPSLKPALCTIEQSGLTQDNLFDNLGDIEGGGLTEDLGRYIGFGQRVFKPRHAWTKDETKPLYFYHLGYSFLRVFFHQPGCYGLNTTAKTLCEDPSIATDTSRIENLMKEIGSDSNQYKFLENIITRYDSLSGETDQTRITNISTHIQKLITDYVQGNVVEVKQNNNHLEIAIPYAYLTPLNVIFNRSLQNLSSYYTDIGFIWILPLILLLAGVMYAGIISHKRLLLLHIITLIGWIIWWFIASGIIWYAVGIIAWTIFSITNFLIILYHHITQDEKSPDIQTRGWYSIVGILVLTMIIQLIFNFLRISSQGGAGAFTRYKGNTGREVQFVITPQGLSQQEIINTRYSAQDVFNMQFGHYNPFISYVKDRADKDGVLIAGTYLQYFLHNQQNIHSDALLTTLRQRGSDNNTCNLALRLQDKNIKYLVIDPNIGSVVMGGGNASLFDRFFARVDSNNTIISHGVISMLHKMIKSNYLTLINTNNMGAKYAFSLSDEELQHTISILTHTESKDYLSKLWSENPLLLRAKLSVPRYFGQESQYYFVLVGELFEQRLSNGIEGMTDLADILGKEIRTDQVIQALDILSKTKDADIIIKLNASLNDDERTVLGYYSAYLMRKQANDVKGIQELLQQLLQQSLAGGSQLITFELKI